jgi:hypothetical protein
VLAAGDRRAGRRGESARRASTASGTSREQEASIACEAGDDVRSLVHV